MTDHRRSRARGPARQRSRRLHGADGPGSIPFSGTGIRPSCALGWITFDEPRAWRELERLLEGQWDDGMVPHIVFHAPSDTYFPGPDVWGTPHTPPTSGITQPPVLASAARLCWDARATRRWPRSKLAALYPRTARLASLVGHGARPGAQRPRRHAAPWESGMDNSPAWDEALARVARRRRPRSGARISAMSTPRCGRARTSTSASIALIDLYASLDWQPARMWTKTPFKIADRRPQRHPASRQSRPAGARARASARRRSRRKSPRGSTTTRRGDRSPVERRRPASINRAT